MTTRGGGGGGGGDGRGERERRSAPGEWPGLLRSSMFDGMGVPGGFTTRLGGASDGVFASLNFGNPGELGPDERDPPGNIAANFRIVLEQMGARGREVVEVHQVHGAGVHVVRRGEPVPTGGRDVKADAIVTDDPGRIVGVRVADCAPVLIASADGRVVAAVHAGWRGVIANVAGAACAAMQRELGAGTLLAVVGPCISAEHFEVGPEVAAEFERVFPGAEGIVIRGGGEEGGEDGEGTVGPRRAETGREASSTVDLKAALTRQLFAAGVEAVEALPHCTFAQPGLFFSHRRERGRTGRMIALIGPAGAAKQR